MCEQEIENRILDYRENLLSPAQRQEVENHLAGCAACRIFAQQLHQLDAALLAAVKVPGLSADFDRRLRERIEGEPVVLPEAQRAERKRQLQAEFGAGMARIGRGSFALGNLLTHLIWPVVATGTGWIVWLLTSQMTSHLRAQNLAGIAPNVVPWLAASAVFLAVGVVEVFRGNGNFMGFGGHSANRGES
jgi:anti-sigma factor RsiW